MAKIGNKDPIGMFTRTMQTLSKQRTSASDTPSSSSAASKKSTLSPIKDEISISVPRQESLAQALTKGMTEKSFKSAKESGAYMVKLYSQLKDTKGG